MSIRIQDEYRISELNVKKRWDDFLNLKFLLFLWLVKTQAYKNQSVAPYSNCSGSWLHISVTQVTFYFLVRMVSYGTNIRFIVYRRIVYSVYTYIGSTNYQLIILVSCEQLFQISLKLLISSNSRFLGCFASILH